MPDWMRKGLADEQQDQQEQTDNESNPATLEIKLSEIDREQLETFILKHKLKFEDIEFDYPELLKKRRFGKTWMDIARELGVESKQLQNTWVTYKKHAARQMIDTNGAA